MLSDYSIKTYYRRNLYYLDGTLKDKGCNRFTEKEIDKAAERWRESSDLLVSIVLVKEDEQGDQIEIEETPLRSLSYYVNQQLAKP